MTIEISTPEQADLIHALATGGSAECQQAIARILLANRGSDLTHLKNAINATDDHRDFDHIVHHVIDDEALRDQVIAHVKAEATTVAQAEVKVLSDIDDTAFASINDQRYPRGTQYPGVLAFWTALDRGPTDRPFSLGDLVFVTARPGTSLGIVERNLIARMHEAGVGDHSFLVGSFSHVFTHSRMAEKKLENISRFYELFGEYHLVFVGDSGQGDVIVGRELLRRFPGRVLGVFIHDVSATDPEERAESAASGIWFFDSYAAAATKAFEQGLISPAGLQQVVDACESEQSAITWDSPAQRDLADTLMEQDLKAARALLVAQSVA
jgi:hypothetical protein